MTATDDSADASCSQDAPPSKSSSSSNNKSGSNKNAKKGKKRKLNKQSRAELYIAEHKDRYNKLHHACSKLLHREGKVVKSFMCQKVGKEIKAAEEKESSIQQDSEEAAAELTAKLLAKTQKRRAKLEQKLELTKNFELSSIVDVGLKRLGVLTLNSSMNMSDDDEKDTTDDKNASNKPSSSQVDDPFYVDLIESMLQHKRLSSAMDQLNDKVTEFRQWSTRRQNMLMGGDDPTHADEYARGNKKRKKQMDKTNETLIFAGGKKNGRNMGGHEGTSGLFIGSLSGIPVEGYDEGGEDDEDDYGYDDVMDAPKKKNRPGQRQRKAKAMAIEAKKAGRTWDASNNWREKKKGNVRKDDSRSNGGRRGNEVGKNDQRHSDNADSSKPRKAEEIAEMGKSWKEEGNAHPSWAAAAAQKSQGIQAFKASHHGVPSYGNTPLSK
eukprot:scaffold254_cov156-Skeletonema_menzelii.AAC.4